MDIVACSLYSLGVRVRDTWVTILFISYRNPCILIHIVLPVYCQYAVLLISTKQEVQLGLTKMSLFGIWWKAKECLLNKCNVELRSALEKKGITKNATIYPEYLCQTWTPDHHWYSTIFTWRSSSSDNTLRVGSSNSAGRSYCRVLRCKSYINGGNLEKAIDIPPLSLSATLNR